MPASDAALVSSAHPSDASPAAADGAARPRTTTVGVLALQGDVAEHLRAITAAGARPVPVRRPAELAAVDGLIIPGGESTTIWKLAAIFDLVEPLRERIGAGLPVFGSCAGMIMLASRLVERASEQETFGAIDMTVRRNAFGRQADSFESDIEHRRRGRPAVPRGVHPRAVGRGSRAGG